AGSKGNYGQGVAEADGTGVYAIQPVLAEPAQGGVFGVPEAFQSCSDSGLVRVVQGDETLGFWERVYPPGDVPASSDAELRLHDGPLRIVHDGFGMPGCSRPAALLKSFEA
ncbi:MAG: hypothetical protein LC623_05580, partial [Halobacteriales archaeon]|nr:hypothetical protein [Halobacteriales archaeon]